ncbi:O-antigen ligase family protein [Flavobacterium sp.]|uniref:O-antigen ligase family protein n=1 Tax=Flavobacterium sp. TaxID=239 RepID=UPI002FD9A520
MKKISLKLFPFLISFLFIFPILKESLSSFIVILICLNTIIYKIAAKDYTFPKPKTLLLTIPFWIILIRSLFTSHFSVNATHIQHALFFLLLPVFFLLIPKEFFRKEKLNLYFEILKNACFVIAFGYVIAFLCVYNFSDFFVFKYDIPKFRDFVYSEVPFFKIHPTYYTSIVFLCTAYSFEKVLKEKKYMELIYIAVFIMITFMLLAKINIIMIVGLLLFMLVFRSQISVKQKIASSAFFLVTTMVLVLAIPGIKLRFIEVFKSYNKPPVGVAYDSTNIRVSIYNCCWNIAKDNYLLGVGFENLQTELNTCYKSNYDSSFYASHDYMTHNYYFYLLLSSGIIGLLCYFFYLLTVIRICWKTNLFLFKVLLFNVLIICCVEDYLYRHYGILYFNLMLVCFLQYSKNKESDVLEVR